jgi:tRNA dimethylallyltransferase
MNSGKPPLVVVAGPTGVGKTDVAIRLAARLPVEVVSADSRQVYRRMDIGTGKPTPADLGAVPHHLIDVVEPDEPYHAARFKAEAEAAITDCRRRGRLPLVVGGTGLYIRALVRGLRPAPPRDPELRRTLIEWSQREGSHALHVKLAALDPAAAHRIHPRDQLRLVRALEVHYLTGRPPGDPTHWRERRPEFQLLEIGLTMPRNRLYGLLEKRVRRMVELGLRDEVHRLLEEGYDERLPAMQGIGYRHFAGAIRGRHSEDEAIRTMTRDTKRYAKRQWTWFAREADIQWVNVEASGGVEGAAEVVRTMIERSGVLE